MDAAAAREGVTRLRRRLTLASSGIYVVLAAECAWAVAFGETTWAIVKNWATRFESKRARELGFTAETSFDEIIKAHIEDELGGKIA